MSSSLKLFLIFLTTLTFGINASARVFDFNSQTFSTYLRATGGMSALQRGGYAPGLPNTVTFSDSNGVISEYSIELGLAFSKPAFTTRIGAEFLYPYSMAGSTGSNPGGPSLFNMNSQTYSVIPQINFEIYLKRKPTYRYYFALGGGYAITTINNAVTMTPQGNAAYGIGNYTEAGTGSGIMGQGYFGLEFPAFDNVGLSIDLGYRYLVASQFKANSTYTSPLGTINQGSSVPNADGSSRTVNLSGVFAAVNLRFYFN